mmetsp:Transcript_8351/g.38043  ORF Transcript_8351/g.38043 Transcript_8351/m.38043 type:complete len:446 (-) Transcript_8351:530-1867(-)
MNVLQRCLAILAKRPGPLAPPLRLPPVAALASPDVPVRAHRLERILIGNHAQVLRPRVGIVDGVVGSLHVVRRPARVVDGVVGHVLLRQPENPRLRQVRGGAHEAAHGPEGVRDVLLGQKHVHVVHRAVEANLASVLVPGAHLHHGPAAGEHLVDTLLDVVRDPHRALVHLDEDGKGGGRLTLHDGLLASPRARLVVAQRHRLHAADEVSQRGVLDEVLQELAVRCAHELHAALRDGPARDGFRLCADLIDDDHLRHVVLHRLDHDLVLLRRVGHLHATRAADGAVGNVSVAADLVAGVDDHDPLTELIGENTRDLADHGGLADARPAEEQDGLVARQHVLNHLHVASHRPADPAGEPHDLSTPVPDGRYAVQGTLDPRPVIPAEITDGRLRRVQVRLRDHLVAEKLVGDVAGEPRLGPAAEVEDDLEELVPVGVRPKYAPNVIG